MFQQFQPGDRPGLCRIGLMKIDPQSLKIYVPEAAVRRSTENSDPLIGVFLHGKRPAAPLLTD